MAWAFAAAAVVVITSFTSSYTYVNAEQQHTTINCSTKSSNKKSSEQTTTDGLIFAFFDFRPRNFLLANNIPKANKILHTPNEGVEIANEIVSTKKQKPKLEERERKFGINLKLNSGLKYSYRKLFVVCNGPIQ